MSHANKKNLLRVIKKLESHTEKYTAPLTLKKMTPVHFLTITLLSLALGVQATAQQESIVHTELIEKEIPGSEDLHKRLGYPNRVDKQFATITFKKRTTDEAHLIGLELEWHSKKKIDALSASLFKKDSASQKLLPTEEHHMSDGYWNAETQTLSFKINPPVDLQGTTSLALVFVVNQELEKTLKTGNFCFVSSSLPEPFQSSKKDALALVHKHKDSKHPVS